MGNRILRELMDGENQRFWLVAALLNRWIEIQ